MLEEELIAIAQYLYGEIWQSDLAYDLGIGTRTTRYWLNGRPIKDSIAKEICQLARTKHESFKEIEKILKKYEQ